MRQCKQKDPPQDCPFLLKEGEARKFQPRTVPCSWEPPPTSQGPMAGSKSSRSSS